MRLVRHTVWGIILVLLLAPTLALAAPKFPALSGRVVDEANMLSPATEQKLTGELEALEKKTGHQLVVATLPDLQGYEIEDYGYQLGRTWKLGRKGEDDGAILIVAPSQRKVRIEVGYGLEPVLTDAMSRLIIERRIIPAFKAGDMEGGVVAGTEAIIAQLGLPPDQARAQAEQAFTATADQGEGFAMSPATGATLILVLIALSIIMKVLGGRRRFGGGDGGGWLLWAIASALMSGGGRRDGGGWSSGGGGGFSGGGGSFGGGGASGRW